MNRDARLLIAGQCLSMLGDAALWLAMGVWVKALTGSSSAAGMVWFAFVVGGLTAPLAGVVADRVRRRPLLIATNLACTAGVLVLTTVHGRHDVWLIYLVMFTTGVSYALLNAGRSALLTLIVPSTGLARANAAVATVQLGVQLVSPLIGAGLFSLVGPDPIIVGDAATLLMGTLALVLMRTREPRMVRAEATAGWAELSAGVRHILRNAMLRRIILAGSIALLGMSLQESVVYSVAQSLHRPPAFVGVLWSAMGGGAIIGGIVAGPVLARLGEVRTAGLGLGTAAVGPLLMVLPVLPTALAGQAIVGFGLPCLIAAMRTAVQRLTPPELQGRAAAALGLSTSTPQTVGVAAGAALLAVVDHRALLVLMGVASGLPAAYLFRRPATATSLAPVRASKLS